MVRANSILTVANLEANNQSAGETVLSGQTVLEKSDKLDSLELSVVMPCLNEAETLAVCIEKALRAMSTAGISGEVIIADNGSIDGSQEIARKLGVSVVDIVRKGYGRALEGGIAAARGEYVIMGDSDDSYDFGDIPRFVEKLREGHDLVMGNRFRGGIMPGAMPWKHRWIGNPILTGIGRLFFHCPSGDFHCGLRGFRKDAYQRLGLRTSGMEFASEMVIKSTLMGLDIAEIPTILHPDGRSRPPHLRSWRDGWRHLKFMLLFSPRWLFMIPGISLMLVGIAVMLWLSQGPRFVGHIGFDIHTLHVAAFVTLLGYQMLVFALFTKVFAITERLHPPSRWLAWFGKSVTTEVGIVAGLAVGASGLGLLVAALMQWQTVGYGELDPAQTMRQVIPAVLLMTLGVETIFASFFMSVLGMRNEK